MKTWKNINWKKKRVFSREEEMEVEKQLKKYYWNIQTVFLILSIHRYFQITNSSIKMLWKLITKKFKVFHKKEEKGQMKNWLGIQNLMKKYLYSKMRINQSINQWGRVWLRWTTIIIYVKQKKFKKLQMTMKVYKGRNI